MNKYQLRSAILRIMAKFGVYCVIIEFDPMEVTEIRLFSVLPDNNARKLSLICGLKDLHSVSDVDKGVLLILITVLFSFDKRLYLFLSTTFLIFMTATTGTWLISISLFIGLNGSWYI